MTRIRFEKLALLASLVAGSSCGCAGGGMSGLWNGWPFCGPGPFSYGGSCLQQRTLAIPDTYPLGTVNRAHYHVMQTNAEASDFIVHRHEFLDDSAVLTPFGKDHIVEIAARARSTPFPVIVERSEHNCDPELDEHRRWLIAQILIDFGVPEGDQRTIVAPAYGRGLNSREGEFDYYNFIYTRGLNGFGNTFGQTGMFGGAGAGGLGFGQF
jgi:hypothetical protein